MQLTSLINAANEIVVMITGYYKSLNFLGQFARVIIEGVGIVGLGVIVFTLVLKAITLPFDIYQRFKMRKQTLIMRNMKDDLDKLQKQYAGDKQMYNQKMMELQKKNGYSILGACLPMIISLVILIVAFEGFRAYANYANLQTFEVMSEHYNAAILDEYGVDGKDYRTHNDQKEDDELTRDLPVGTTWTENGIIYTVRQEVTQEAPQEGETPETATYLQVMAEDTQKFVYYEYELGQESITRVYFVNEERFLASDYYNKDPDPEKPEEQDKYLGKELREEIAGLEGKAKTDRIVAVVERIGALAARDYFRKDGPHFLWIGNVWYPDVSYNHPIPKISELTKLGTVTIPNGDGKTKVGLNEILEAKDRYTILVSELQNEQKHANGYYVLVILSVGLMVLSQFISMKSSKESNKYQTVDGRGATSQKVMLVVLPLIYGVFAFMMSAAFSIYMIVSSIFAILVTLLSNLIIGHIFNKKEEAKFKEEHTRKLPWMEGYGKKGAKGDKKKDKKKK